MFSVPSPIPRTHLTPDIAYTLQLQCGRQWRGFLLALGQEFVSALPPHDLMDLMARIGARFATQHPLAAGDTLTSLEEAINGVWDTLQWGMVELGQTSEAMEIQHRFSPLTAAFGEAGANWAAGFLQGAYQQWLDAAGAQGLKVAVVAPLDAVGSVHLRLGAG